VNALDTVRLLVGDQPRYDRALASGDGLTVDFQVAHAPVQTAVVSAAGQVLATPADYLLDGGVGVVTLAVAPADGAAIAISYRYTLLSDDALQSLLDLELDPKLAAAQALDIIASSQALLLKKMTILDLSIDGVALAAQLHSQAKDLRAQVIDEGMAFDWAEMVMTHSEAVERLRDQILRGIP